MVGGFEVLEGGGLAQLSIRITHLADPSIDFLSALEGRKGTNIFVKRINFRNGAANRDAVFLRDKLHLVAYAQSKTASNFLGHRDSSIAGDPTDTDMSAHMIRIAHLGTRS